MKRLSLITLAAAAALMSATAAQAQPAPGAPPPLPEYGGTVTLEQAMKMGNAAVAEAKKLNVHLGITVVDNAGRLVYFMKMDDTRRIGVDLSQGKARTAAATKVPSKAYEDRVAAGGAGLAVLSLGVTASSGGLPIMMNGKMSCAIGVGGGPTGLLDQQVAQAGLDALK